MDVIPPVFLKQLTFIPPYPAYQIALYLFIFTRVFSLACLPSLSLKCNLISNGLHVIPQF